MGIENINTYSKITVNLAVNFCHLGMDAGNEGCEFMALHQSLNKTIMNNSIPVALCKSYKESISGDLGMLIMMYATMNMPMKIVAIDQWKNLAIKP